MPPWTGGGKRVQGFALTGIDQGLASRCTVTPAIASSGAEAHAFEDHRVGVAGRLPALEHDAIASTPVQDGTRCQVFAENMEVQLADEGVLCPDAMVTCGKAEAGDEQAVTDPKLVIEVLSPSSKGYDKRDKFILYRTLASLREYVLIEPAKRQVEVFTLAEAEGWLLTDQTGGLSWH